MRKSLVKLSGVVKAVTKLEAGSPSTIKVAVFGEWNYGDSMGSMKNMGL